MKRIKCIAPLLFVATLALQGADSASAALAPSTVKRMKKEASDVLRVDVVSVKTTGIGLSKLDVTIRARVTGVERTASGVKVGDTIQIQSYRLTGLILAPGPQNPPSIPKGWQGTIWLEFARPDHGMWPSC